MRLGLFTASAALAAFVSIAPASAVMVPIPGLYSTGVDDDGVVMPHHSREMHWSFGSVDSVPTVSDGSGGVVPTSSLVVRTFTQPNPDTETSWSGDSTTSDWIGPDNSNTMMQPSGRYYYSTVFFLGPDVDPASAQIVAYVFGDDGIADVRLNTVDTGFQNFVPGTIQSPFQVPTKLVLNSGFEPGPNTLEVRVDNGAGPSGLRVQVFSSVEQTAFGSDPSDIPEPGSLAVLLGGVLALAGSRRLAARERVSSPVSA